MAEEMARATALVYAVAALAAEERLRDLLASCSSIEQALACLDTSVAERRAWVEAGISDLQPLIIRATMGGRADGHN